ncbi:MAG TPA: hypothetical protein PKY99_13145, partial [Turneriella sp.]|nr:hypothetical protein [Turneriella sp.]
RKGEFLPWLFSVAAEIATGASGSNTTRSAGAPTASVPVCTPRMRAGSRHPEAISSLGNLVSGRFQEVIGDEKAEATKVKRVIICTGKVYYDLLKERSARNLEHIALVRLEQIYPFKYDQVGRILEGYPNLSELFWVQEEPKNMGAWFYIKDRFDERLAGGKFQNMIRCIARKTSPSPAAGLQKVHEREQKELLDRALG